VPYLIHAPGKPLTINQFNKKESESVTMSTTTSTTAKPKVIKAKLGLGHLAAQLVLNAALNVLNNLFVSSFFAAAAGVPAPPVDQATMKAATDALQAAITAAAGGGKQAITAKNHAKEAAV